MADAAGIAAAIWVVAAITAGSGVVVFARMRETHPVVRSEPVGRPPSVW